MSEFVFFINNVIVSGLVAGSIYALGAVGVTLIFGILRFAHFAHGDMMTLGAFITLVLSWVLAGMGVSSGLPLAYFVVPLAVAITIVAALGLDRLFYAPLRAKGAKPVTLLIASIGVTMMLQGLIRLLFGTGTYSLFDTVPKVIHRIPVEGSTRDITFTQPQAIGVIVTIIAVVALHLFLKRSRNGKAMRAVADNPDLAQVSGINIRKIVRLTWIIGAGLACLAGTFLALDVTVKPDLAFNILLPIFAAAIVGGVGQVYGAIVAGYLIGFAEVLAVFNWGVLLRPFRDSLPEWVPAQLAIVPTEYKVTVAFVILVVTLLLRPTGIFRGASST
ncbi:MAG: branched-chain amino acid ABC transporter permease [Bauldia sp.]|nr:branched-chain amino acid ABC transporter permease [Bauldia sp.]